MDKIKKFIFDIEILTTKEFCTKFNVPLPKFFPDDMVKSVGEWHRIDAVKYTMVRNYISKLSDEGQK